MLDGIESNGLPGSMGRRQTGSAHRTSIAVLLAGLVLLLAAGCGGLSGTASSPDGARLVGSNVLAFVSIDTDLGSDQWQQVDDLSKKFPGRDTAVEQIKQAFAKHHVDWNDDVKPALGPEFDIVVAAGATPNDASVVGLTKPDDAGKFKALVKKLNEQDSSGQPAVYREVDGWYALSDSQQKISSVLSGSGNSLSDNATFEDALGKLPDDALAKAYLDGPQLSKLIESAGRGSGLAGSSAIGKLDFVSAALSAEDDGLRLHGAVAGPGSKDLSTGNYESELMKGVPADALALLSFRGGKGIDQLERQLDTNPELSSSVPQIERTLGVKIGDILDLLRGETAFYLRPGAPVPEFSLVLTPSDPTAGLATLDTLAARLAAYAHAKVTSTREDGRKVKVIDLQRFAVRYVGLGDKILITSGLNGIGSYTGSGSKLPDAADFKEAKAASALPSSNTGFVFIDLKNSIALIESFAGLSGESLPTEVTANLRPLRSFTAWGATAGKAFTFDAFVEIK
jgi:hypothetical protein